MEVDVVLVTVVVVVVVVVVEEVESVVEVVSPAFVVGVPNAEQEQKVALPPIVTRQTRRDGKLYPF